MKPLLLILSILLLSCKGISQDRISYILNKQIQHGYAIKEEGLDMTNNYYYQEDDYDAIKILSLKILNKSGYKFPNKEQLEDKLKRFLSLKIKIVM